MLRFHNVSAYLANLHVSFLFLASNFRSLLSVVRSQTRKIRVDTWDSRKFFCVLCDFARDFCIFVAENYLPIKRKWYDKDKIFDFDCDFCRFVYEFRNAFCSIRNKLKISPNLERTFQFRQIRLLESRRKVFGKRFIRQYPYYMGCKERSKTQNLERSFQ